MWVQQDTSPFPPVQFQVVLISPDGYPHAGAFKEIAETVAYGLVGLGCRVSMDLNRLVYPGPPAIMFGANLLTAEEADRLPDEVVIYNLEQIDGANAWCSPAYLGLLRRCRVWDYSARNLSALAELGVHHAAHVPVGYVPQLTRIQRAGAEDIDVLFYGSLNERRRNVLERLRGLGLNVRGVFGVYGEQRDALIARAKLVLNVHYYETSIFELVRVSYLLANRTAVVAECHAGTDIEPDMRDAVALAAYDDLAATCVRLAKDRGARLELAERGYDRIAARDERDYLLSALGAALPAGAL